MKNSRIVFILLLLTNAFCSSEAQKKLTVFEADNSHFQYTGRIDFSDPKKPRFWMPGVYIKAKFKGTQCSILMNDENLGGNTFNYLEVVIDNQEPIRIQTTGKSNEIDIAKNLSNTEHTITICKNTENNIGYLEFVGLRCEKLLPPPAKQSRRIEFIGNSITCGTGVDQSSVACGEGRWHDQHNAYMSYGPRTARALNAQWMLSAYSGIGLIHSCCDIKFTMPDIYDKVNMSANAIPWDFSKYQPDIVTICLGQNDGIQDSISFTAAYVKFIQQIRSRYPNTNIVCLTSPMGNAQLTSTLKNYLTGIVNHVNAMGDKKVSSFFFSQSWNNGCDTHPDINDHEAIATELTAFIKQKFGW